LPEDDIEIQMRALIQRWDESSDRRSVFLKCYLMMTQNMHLAIQLGEFRDPAWVDHLVNHFAGFIYGAWAFEREPAAPPVANRLTRQLAKPKCWRYKIVIGRERISTTISCSPWWISSIRSGASYPMD
jgi:hypothetical protein